MPVEVHSESDGRILEMHLSGTLVREDYKNFLPPVEHAIQEHDKVRMLVDMHDFHGWAPGAAWEDLKFGVKHFNHVDRIALVGEKKWEQWLATFCKPFTTATVRYFPREQCEDAQKWIHAA